MTILIRILHSIPVHDWLIRTGFPDIVHSTELIGILNIGIQGLRCAGSGQTPLEGTRNYEQ